MKSFFYLAVFAVSSLFFMSCEKEDSPISANPDKFTTMTIKFDNFFGHHDFEFNKEYSLTNGTKVNLNMLKYFISNIVLHKSGDNSTYVIPQDSSYFLLDESNPNSMNLRIYVPEGDYTGITFTVGIDSLRNTMPLERRTGVLDVTGVAEGMYWSWNSGYIFVKIEGDYITTEKNGMFKYHIGLFGGYSTPTVNNVKNVNLSFGRSTAQVRVGSDTELHIIADIKKVFEGVNAMNLAETPTIMGAPISAKVAENYENMFEFDHIH